MPSKRPELTPKLDPGVFAKCYWEVKELAAFCRDNSLSTSGLKAELTQRVKDFLSGSGHAKKTVSKAGSQGPRDSAVPGGLKLSTLVKNYNNDAITRSFFQKHCGQAFRFNEYLRQFSKGVPAGQQITYGDLVKGWKDAEELGCFAKRMCVEKLNGCLRGRSFFQHRNARMYPLKFLF